MHIQVLVDNPESWIVPYAHELVSELSERGHEAKVLFRHNEVVKGDILCLLACENIFKRLDLNRHNLVVHESDLPKGKGWSPVTWQVLEGKNSIPVTLFEASQSIDGGPIYKQLTLQLNGHELLSEIKHKQGEITKQLIIDFVLNYNANRSRPQIGEPTYYSRRGPENSLLDINKSIAEQFNLLRVCDNERYPAFFIMDGIKYIIKIEKD